jgi:hypothetical protein
LWYTLSVLARGSQGINKENHCSGLPKLNKVFFPSYHNQFVYLVYLVSLSIIIFYYIIKIKINLFDPVIDFIPSLEHAYDASISYFYT